jgi:hypothetical protein
VTQSDIQAHVPDIAMLVIALQENPVGGLLLVLLVALIVVGIWVYRARPSPPNESKPAAHRPARGN